ncbi:glycosyltransferase [Anthocerotibacter panamensis]|uniref:glycosyltransferase n=1 Tax=Anthocerotibacter panamensis TaxID=2857077 RepID=UPI001C4022AF|nr:glycosyltransferase [Anthocerotibacter panamensis]
MSRLLCICASFPPEVTPTAIRTGKLLNYLREDWQIQVITCVPNGKLTGVQVHPVLSWYPKALIDLFHQLRLNKLLEWLIWPDVQIFWAIPAFLRARSLMRTLRPTALVVFMMPYSSGLVGIGLKWLTGLPLVLNLDDSPTCSDMHPVFPSRLHYYLAHWLEDFYVRQADAIVYVSQFNRDTVRARQPEAQQQKFHLVRYGADPIDSIHPQTPPPDDFSIVYIGGMSGWHAFQTATGSWLRKLYRAWMELGNYHVLPMDYRSSSPAFLGQAIKLVEQETPDWRGKIHLRVYGNQYPQAVVDRLLHTQQIADVVTISGPVPNTQALQLAAGADLLFLTLPARLDGSAGGRISAKTYEYLMTPCPILAAVPRGENWDYLKDKPGVWLVEPTDVFAMAQVLTQLAQAKKTGAPLTFDRSPLFGELSYAKRAGEFAHVLQQISR